MSAVVEVPDRVPEDVRHRQRNVEGATRKNEGPDVVVRLPRTSSGRSGWRGTREMAVLQQIESARDITDRNDCDDATACATSGRPHEVFPHRWSVLGWIDGVDAVDQPATDLASTRFARRDERAHLGQARDRDRRDLRRSMSGRERPAGSRGGPLRPLCSSGWIRLAGHTRSGTLPSLLDVAGVRRLAAEALEIVQDEPVVAGRFVHGDLIPGEPARRRRAGSPPSSTGAVWAGETCRTGLRARLGSADRGRAARISGGGGGR